MSVKFPPQVEFNREGNRNALSFTSSRRGPAITPQTCTFFPNASRDRKSTRLNSSHLVISYAVFCLKKKKQRLRIQLTSLSRPIHNKKQTAPQTLYKYSVRTICWCSWCRLHRSYSANCRLSSAHTRT